MMRTAVNIASKAKLLRGFSDPSRLSILEVLQEGSLSVGEITEATGLTQPNTSNHLACLLGCGLVRREQRGRFTYYELSDARISAFLKEAEAILLEVALGVEGCDRYELSEVEGGSK